MACRRARLSSPAVRGLQGSIRRPSGTWAPQVKFTCVYHHTRSARSLPPLIICCTLVWRYVTMGMHARAAAADRGQLHCTATAFAVTGTPASTGAGNGCLILSVARGL
mgnify:CR=1 FL=1